MSLDYRGRYGTGFQDVLNLATAQQMIQNASQSEAQMRAEVEDELKDKASTADITSVANSYVSTSQASTLFSSKANSSLLGSTIARLGSNKVLPTSYFPPVTTRGAQFFSFTGTITNKASTSSNGPQELARLSVSNSNSPYYSILVWAQIEAKLQGPGQTPGVEVVTNTGTRLSFGMGSAGWTTDWGIIDCVPVRSQYVYTGTQSLILRTNRAGLGGDTIDYSGYKPNFCAMTIPVSYTP